MTTTTITVEDYRTVEEKRNLANQILKKGGIPLSDVYLIVEKADYWEVHFYLRRKGKRYFQAGTQLARGSKRVDK